MIQDDVSDVPRVDVDAQQSDPYFASVVAAEPLAYYPLLEFAGEPTVRNWASFPPSARVGNVVGATLGLRGVRGSDDRAMSAEDNGARISLSWEGIPTGNEPFTIELVVHPVELDMRPRMIAVHPDPSNVGFAGYRLLAQGTEVSFERVGENGQMEKLRADHMLVKGRWSHVATTFDGARLRLFVDGKVIDEFRTTLRVGGGGEVLAIGASSDDELPFAGYIDEIAVYSKELSPETVLKHAELLR